MVLLASHSTRRAFRLLLALPSLVITVRCQWRNVNRLFLVPNFENGVQWAMCEV